MHYVVTALTSYISLTCPHGPQKDSCTYLCHGEIPVYELYTLHSYNSWLLLNLVGISSHTLELMCTKSSFDEPALVVY